MKERKINFSYKSARIALLTLLSTSLAGCHKDLSPPAKNAEPKARLNIHVQMRSGVPRNLVMTAEYGNLAKKCSNIDILRGGSVIYPHGYIEAKRSSSGYVLYRDYYSSRSVCPWELMGVDFRLSDKMTGKELITGLLGSQIKIGAKYRFVCGRKKLIGVCTPSDDVPNKDGDVLYIEID